MFGSIAVEQWIYQQLSAAEAVTDYCGQEIHVPYAPQDAEMPYCVAYRTDAIDETPMGIGLDVGMERLTYAVAIVAETTSKRALLRAGLAMHQALQGLSGTVEVLDDQGELFARYFVVGGRIGELPNDDIALPDAGVEYRALGGMYQYDVTTG